MKYKVYTVLNSENLEEVLNDKYKEGWELSQYIEGYNGKYDRCIFKKMN